MKAIKNRGFSLIEVLVSVVILSIGLLSIAALQMNAKKATYDSIQRTTASQLASDIIERMRANNNEVNSVHETYITTVSSTPITADACDEDSPCINASALALYDLSDWQERLVDGLQSPTACITRGGNSHMYTIAIAWRGVEKLTNSTLSSCGNSKGLYGTNDEYRRILTVDFFISTVSG